MKPGVTVNFDSAGSRDPDGTIASYAWNFGDGRSSNLRNPTNVFGSLGTFTVSLTVTDDGGKTDTVTHPITITANQPPNAAFTFAPQTPAIHDLVTFTDESTDDDGVVSESWSIDGVLLSGPVARARACPPSMNVTLDAFDHAGQSGQQQLPCQRLKPRPGFQASRTGCR